MGTFDSKDVALPTLESVLDQNEAAGEVNLAVVNIPVNQIVGFAPDNDRDMYASDFLPLPSIKGECAQKWTQMFVEHLSDSGQTDLIRCYEYLGKFYVVDGKKHVSAVKAHGTSTIKAV